MVIQNFRLVPATLNRLRHNVALPLRLGAGAGPKGRVVQGGLSDMLDWVAAGAPCARLSPGDSLSGPANSSACDLRVRDRAAQRMLDRRPSRPASRSRNGPETAAIVRALNNRVGTNRGGGNPRCPPFEEGAGFADSMRLKQGPVVRIPTGRAAFYPPRPPFATTRGPAAK